MSKWLLSGDSLLFISGQQHTDLTVLRESAERNIFIAKLFKSSPEAEGWPKVSSVNSLTAEEE